jgi:signal transduction histidine kinase/HAMP domain-containing protein
MGAGPPGRGASRRGGLGLRSLRVRIVSLFVAALIALFGALAFLLWQQQRTARSLEVVTASYLPLSKVAARLDRDRQRVATDLERLMRDERRPGTGAESPAAIYTEAFARNLELGRRIAAGARRLAGSAEERAVLNKVDVHLGRIESLAREYEDLSARFIALAEGGRGEVPAALTDELRATGDALGTEIEQLVRLVDSRIAALAQSTEAAQVRGVAVTALLSLVALGLAVVLVGATAVALRPIGRLTEQVQRLARGQAIGRVEVRGSDELAVLGREFNDMAEALRQRDARLRERAEELRRVSRYLSSVVDSLQETLIVVDGAAVTLANPAATRTWEAQRGEPPPAPLAALGPGRHELQGPGRTLHEVRVAPFGDGGAVIVSSDITEQTATRERLSRSERLALVGQMLAQITHEVRNPLNALSLNAELMADELEGLDPQRNTEAWELLATISGEVDRLTAVTGHYLQLARRPPARLDPTHLGDLVDDVVRLVRPELEQAGVALRVEGGRPGPVEADGNQLRQALLNVVRNAVEAGARHLELRVRTGEDEVALELRDDGPGMTAEEAERAFDPFWSSKASGTGLGLAITKQILEDHGGGVRVQTRPGRGTTVTLTLPHRAAHAQPAPA